MDALPAFDDLLDLRTGGERMTLGSGETRIVPLETREQWEAKAEALRELYRLLLGKPPAGYEGPLELRILREARMDGCARRTVSYRVGQEERIEAYILIPDGPPFPAVVTIHPTNATGREQTIGNDSTPDGQDRAYGLHLARRGYVTISYDIDSTHDRLYPGCTAFENGPLYTKYPDWSGRGKDLNDVSRAIDVLEQTPEVDTARIGAIGHSQGGGITTDAMGLEPRLAVGVSNCGDWPFRMSKNPFNRCRTGWWIGQPQLRPFALTGKPMPIDLHEKLALAAPRPVMVIAALNDFQFGVEEEPFTRPGMEAMAAAVRRVYALCGDPGGLELVLHTRGHSFYREEREAAYAFLDRHLRRPRTPAR